MNRKQDSGRWEQRRAGTCKRPDYRWSIDTEFFRVFTWKERLLIFVFGYRAKVRHVLVTEHKPGKWVPEMALELTTQERAPWWGKPADLLWWRRRKPAAGGGAGGVRP